MEVPSNYADKEKIIRKDGKPRVRFTDVQRKKMYKEIKKWIMQGKGWSDTINLIMEKYGVVEYTAQVYYTECNKQVKEYMDKRKDDILDIQMARMEEVIEATFENKDYTTLLKATDQLNKLARLYEQKVKIETENFTIKIDE